ncbi:hypothetical protein KO498_15525 [Lentibacter algarum]|uniref:hypothetical protein n=1 Tax=Lentibacter algarum TaxID=576131 RepID=UPI001C096158|nr:hypothetical protein [Lentibacter algarum]MBU2983218.1 hypothetical protein [Lentibacter algarum]
MKRAFSLFTLLAFLSACGGDGTNPFDDPIDPTDPSSKNSKFLFDIDDKFTMNDVVYNEASDQLVINNLPFDGPDGIYDRTRTERGVGVYRSRKTGTTGQIRHYAVFMRNEDMQVAAAAGAEWVDVGYGGANVKRNGYNLPGGVGEYVFLGTYGSVRTRSDGAGAHIVTGDVTLLLDIFDFDESGGEPGDGILEGSIVGYIDNRTRTDAETGAPITNNLPTVSLTLVQYDPETGEFDEGITSTGHNGSIRDEGLWEGFVGGSDGSSIGAYVTLNGPAEIQTISYEVATYTAPDGSTGVVSGYTAETDYDAIFAMVNAGEQVGLQTADQSGIPAGSSVSVEIETVTIETAADGREIGVLLTEQEPDS